MGEIPEESEEEIDLLPYRPKYFDEFENYSADSEEELVAGENNYIEIQCLPFEDPRLPQPENNNQAELIDAPEE